MKYCPFCGAELQSGAVSFCPECGKRLHASMEQSAETPQKEDAHEKPAKEKKKPKQRKASKQPKKKKMKEIKRSKSQNIPEIAGEPEDDGYDGYYNDVLPPDLDKLKDGMDQELVRKVVALCVGVTVIISMCVALLYVL